MPTRNIPSVTDTSIFVGEILPFWRELGIVARNRITEDMRRRFLNYGSWDGFTSFLENYISVVETMLRRFETDSDLEIWTMWGEMLEMLDFGQYER